MSRKFSKSRSAIWTEGSSCSDCDHAGSAVLVMSRWMTVILQEQSSGTLYVLFNASRAPFEACATKIWAAGGRRPSRVYRQEREVGWSRRALYRVVAGKVCRFFDSRAAQHAAVVVVGL